MDIAICMVVAMLNSPQIPNCVYVTVTDSYVPGHRFCYENYVCYTQLSKTLWNLFECSGTKYSDDSNLC